MRSTPLDGTSASAAHKRAASFGLLQFQHQRRKQENMRREMRAEET